MANKDKKKYSLKLAVPLILLVAYVFKIDLATPAAKERVMFFASASFFVFMIACRQLQKRIETLGAADKRTVRIVTDGKGEVKPLMEHDVEAVYSLMAAGALVRRWAVPHAPRPTGRFLLRPAPVS